MFMDIAIDSRSVLSEEEFSKAIELALGIQDREKRAAVIFLALTGCRLGEALLVTHGDFAWKDGVYSVVEIPTLKRVGRPRRKVHVVNHGAATRALFDYWDSVTDREGPLFTLSRRTLQLEVEKILSQVKPDRVGLAHIFRHTHASRLIAAGADLTYVRQQMGWANIEMSKRYVHTPEERIEEVLRRLS